MSKGDCFPVAFKTAKKLFATLSEAGAGGEVYVVHGRVLGDGGDAAGIRHWHGWMEFEDLAFDGANDRSIVLRRKIYYEKAQLEGEPFRYRFPEAAGWAFETGHYGPWEGEVDER